MKGFKSNCSRCGAGGYKLGCPSYFDVCTDSEACAERCRRQAQRAVERVKVLEKRLEEYEDDLLKKNS